MSRNSGIISLTYYCNTAIKQTCTQTRLNTQRTLIDLRGLFAVLHAYLKRERVFGARAMTIMDH